MDRTPRTWVEVAADTQSAARRWTEDGLAADTPYRYRVSARNSAGVGVPSSEVGGRTRPQLRLDRPVPYPLTALPQAAGIPRALTAMATHESVTLTWTVPAAGGTVTGYRLWRQTGAEAFAILGPDLGADVLIFRDTGLAAGTVYCYRLQALSAQGPGPLSAAARIGTTVLPGPVGAGSVHLVGGQITLSWTAPTAAGSSAVTHYRVRRRRTSHGQAYTLQATRVTDTRHIEAAPPAEGIWYYSVQAVSAAGTGPWSNPELSGHMLWIGTPPGGVGRGTVRLAGGQVTLSWIAPTAVGSSAVTHYRVRRRRASHGQAYTLRAEHVTGTVHTEAAPTDDGTWYYSVQAVNAAGPGPWSDPGPSGHVLVLPT